MINKYPNEKIKDVDIRTTKNGTRYVNNTLDRIYDLATLTTYGLDKYYDQRYNIDNYVPVRTRRY